MERQKKNTPDPGPYTLDPEQRVLAQIADWSFIAEEYALGGREAGIRAYETRLSRCSLCPPFEAHDLEPGPGGIGVTLQCRRCPIVKTTRRTCIHAWKEGGYPEDFYLDPDTALEVIDKIIAFLEDVLKNERKQ